MQTGTNTPVPGKTDILVVNDSDTEIRAIKRMLEEVAPASRISSHNPSKTDKKCHWRKDTVLMLDSNARQEDILESIQQTTRDKRPYTVMISGESQQNERLGDDISGVAERLSKSTLCPDVLEDLLSRASGNASALEISNTFTPIAAHDLRDSIVALGRSAFDTPFNDVDIANGQACIKGYKIEKIIGMGGMSTAYLAIRESDNRAVAIKTLKPRSLKDDRIIDRFIKEFQIGRSLQHKNIIKIYEQRFLDDFAYIVMDYLPGESLKSVIRNPITPRQAIKYALDITSSLIGLHELGIVHRDIKPSNFHLNQFNQLVLLDFGVSKRFSDDTELTHHGEPIGTPQFMSPEQILEQPVDQRSDLYSLGVILFKMLTGRYPYRSIDTIDLMYKHAYSPVPELPFKLLGLENVIERLLAKEPDNRYESAEAVYSDLVEILMDCNRYISKA